MKYLETRPWRFRLRRKPTNGVPRILTIMISEILSWKGKDKIYHLLWPSQRSRMEWLLTLLKIISSIRGMKKMGWGMDGEDRNFKMVRTMRDIGRMTCPMAKGNLCNLMEEYTKDSLKIKWVMGKGSSYQEIKRSFMKEISRMTFNMEKEFSWRLENIVMRDSLNTKKKMESAEWHGRMEKYTRGNGKMEFLMDKESWLLSNISILVIGNLVSLMVEDFISGKTDVLTTEVM